jgi:hypothetical protein
VQVTDEVDAPTLDRVPEPEPIPPTEPSRWAGEWLNVVIVVAMTAFVFVQLRPRLLFSGNLDVGGDNAAHVAAVYYFVHHLLPHGQLSGWDPQWFDGFPLYVFYFPLPAVLVAFFNTMFPYAVAFNIVTVLGTLLVPICAYAFGRMAGFRRPTPVLMAAMSLVFLFNTSYTIDGGNIASTLAGEFSFSLAIPLGLLFLGFFLKSLRTGRGRWLAALFFALTVVSHVVPALYFAFSALAIAVAQRDRKRALMIAASVLSVGALFAGFWLIRFAGDLGFSSSMNYQRVPSVLSHFFPRNLELSVQILAALGALIALRRKNRVIQAMVAVALITILAFAYLPDGLVYNERWEPFWFLTTALIAAYALAEIGRSFFSFWHLAFWQELATSVIVCGTTVVLIAGNLGILPLVQLPTKWQSFVPGWVQWNYSGYQSKSHWAEYRSLVLMLERSTAKYGCGRLNYEYLPDPTATNYFGSTLVQMAFPMWTNGCVDTTEGVYFESSTTNVFHFLDQSELSLSSSDPVAGIPYEQRNVADGVRHLRLMGVKYFLAISPPVEKAADADPALQKIASMPSAITSIEQNSASFPRTSWNLYLIKHSSLVVPLSYTPVVENGLGKSAWQSTAISWYQQPQMWDVEIARNGPASWPRARPESLPIPAQTKKLATTAVSHVTTTNATISFDVSRLGVPVLVKVPYFPNWQASGADGPFETTPNLMVVVPRAHHVSLHYGTTAIDWTGRTGTVLGAIGLLALGRRPLAPGTSDNEPVTAKSQNGGTTSDEDELMTEEVPATEPDENDEAFEATYEERRDDE